MSAVGGSWFEQDVLYAWLAERGIKVLHQDLYSLLVKLSDYRVSEYERGKREAVPSETVPSEPVAYRWKWDKGLEWHYADYLIEGRDYYAMEPLYTNAAPQVPAKATSGGDAEAADGNRPVQIERKLAATSDVANPASAAISSDKEGKAQEQVKRLHATTDAQVWAQEFNDVLARQYNLRVDEGWLIGWFANAIEVGRDAGKRSADLSARGRILFEDDSFCPGCGHNRDESSVSTIKLNDGRRECQMCGALWSEVDHSSYVVVCSEEKK